MTITNEIKKKNHFKFFNEHNSIYLILAIILTGLFFFTLHPITGFLGGIFFYISEWIIPTAVNVLLSIWLTKLLIKKSEQRKIAFAVISILLGLNANLIKPFSQFDNPEVTKSISKVLNPEKGISVTIKDPELYKDILFPKDPYFAPISVAGDEGCMCLYFIRSDGLLQDIINSPSFHKTASQLTDAKLVLTLEENNNRANIEIEIYQADEILSFIKMENILSVNIKGRYGRDLRLLNGHFYRNTLDILMHDNIWGYILNLFDGNQLSEIKLFLKEAIKS